jgi:hypothetical protein
MDIKELIESLSEQEYTELEKIVLCKIEERENAEIKIIDFIEANKYDMSVRVKNALLRAADEDVYVKKLKRAKMRKYENVGAKTITELEWLLHTKKVDNRYFVS